MSDLALPIVFMLFIAADNRADKFSLPRGVVGRPGSFASECLVHSHPANTHVMH